MNTARLPVFLTVALCGALPFVMGTKEGGCGGSFSSTSPAPDVGGRWSIAYANTMNVKITLGGSVYTQQLSPVGGALVITHQGKPYSFNVDCARPEVVCPSEVWPASVTIDQRDATYQHRMWVKIPVQKCSGQTVAPPANECGAGTPNPECKPVCSGTVSVSEAEAFGLINEAGNKFDLFLGGSFASNGVNCAMLGLSAAQAQILSTGKGVDWQATEFVAGTVKTGFAGGCLWAGPVDPLTNKPEALVVGATLEISTPFTGKRN